MTEGDLIKLGFNSFPIESKYFSRVTYSVHPGVKGLSIFVDNREIIIHKENLKQFISELNEIEEVYFNSDT